MSEDHFLTTEEVLDYLQVNLRTIISPHQGGQFRLFASAASGSSGSDIDAWFGAAAGQTPDRPDRPGVDRRILLVDDEQTVRDLVAKTPRWRLRCRHGAGRPSALDQLRSAEYDLLITDLKMPGMDGLSVIREARQKSAEPLSSSYGLLHEASAIEAINLGVCGYLTKPFRLPRVLAVAACALGEPTPLSTHKRARKTARAPLEQQ
jgi:CheY-like chemotaxis protein